MKVEKETLDDRQIQLTVEVPLEKSKSAMQAAARRLSQRSKISGFRPGKVPYEIVLRKYGEEALLEEAIDTMGQEMYQLALDQAEVQPYAPGKLEEIVSRDPLVLRFTVPLEPEVVLGDYRSLREAYQVPEVSDEAVDALMEELRQGQAIIEPAERNLEMSDVAVLKVHGELLETEEGESERLLEEQVASVLLDDQVDWPFPGIAEHLVGLGAGDEKEVEHTFPEDYPSESLRARKARFHLTVNEVKSRLVPEWTDELARTLGEFEDLLDLRIKVRQQLQDQAERRARAEHTDSVISAVVEQAEISYPPVLLEQEVDDMQRDLDRRLKSQNLTLQDYLRIQGTTVADLRAEFEPSAHERLRRALTLGAVVDAEQVQVSQEEIQEEIDRLVEQIGEQGESIRQTFEHPLGRNRIRDELLTRKVIERLVALAEGKETDEGQAPQGADPSDQEPPSDPQSAGGAEAPAGESDTAPEG